MQGVLIYKQSEVVRNQRFIELFMQAAHLHGVIMQVVYVEDISFGFLEGKSFLYVGGQNMHMDFAVMRVMHPTLSAHLEMCSIPVFNPAKVSAICNDKQKTALYFMQKGLPLVDTAVVSLEYPKHTFSYPVVVKASKGCGGRYVFLCKEEQAYIRALNKIYPDHAVVQPFIQTGGQDIRVYMLGGKIYQCMLRYSEDKQEFRSNFGIHGLAKPIDVNERVAKLAYKAVEGLDTMLVGVDFFVDMQGKVYINEIEDAVGTRMLYQFTNHQVVNDYMALIVKRLKESKK